MPHLFCFGLGYSSRRIAKRLKSQGWHISGTTRDTAKQEAYQKEGMDMYLFDGTASITLPQDVTHILHSIPPEEDGDPVARHMAEAILALPHLEWFGYFSTTGVYGDADGAWVDEASPTEPEGARQRRRVQAEQTWLGMEVPAHIFRLAGIYGPGRNNLESLKKDTAKRIIKPGQYFSRIHVEDIANIVLASIQHPSAGEIFNCCDDMPAPSHEVIEYAADLLRISPPPAQKFEEAELSPMARSFYKANRRVKNDKIKQQLGVKLAYPTYREGLKAIQGTFA